MDTNRVCPNCQKPLAPDVPMGLCPACLIQAGFPSGTESGGAPGATASFVPPAVGEIARRFHQLEILELIGRGGMGAVYKARQKQLNRFVALKILPPGIGQEPAFAERFTREARALAQLNHPGIVTLYEFGQAEGLFYFLMEYVDGLNLRQLLATSRVSTREALAIVPQICDALQYAHDQGIVHRDIKPENILLDRRGRVKVADFGLAKLVGVGNEPAAEGETAAGAPLLTEAGKVMGTPQYMSPEQIQAPGEVDHRADIYALGVVFYQMLTGELPGKRIEPPSRKVQVDVRLDEVVLRALEQKPELRYQQASVMKTQVETIATTPEPAGGSAARPDTGEEAGWEGPSEAARKISAGRVWRVIRWPVLLAGLLFGGLSLVWMSAQEYAWRNISTIAVVCFVLAAVIWAIRMSSTAPAGLRFRLKVLSLAAGVIVLFVSLFNAWFETAMLRRNDSVRQLRETAIDFHNRVFELDAKMVDQLIPLEMRHSAAETNGGVALALPGVGVKSEWAEVSHETLEKLMKGIGTRSSMLSDAKWEVSARWWQPGWSAAWTYTRNDSENVGGGGGGGSYGFRVNDGVRQVRIDCGVTHALNTAIPDPKARFFYEGALPDSGVLAFLVPFARKDGSPHYLVVTDEFLDVMTGQALIVPPFIATLSHATVELLVIGDQPWSNRASWRPNGHPSPEPFPNGNGQMNAWMDGKIMKKIVFRIRNDGPDGVALPVIRTSTNSGVLPAGTSSWQQPTPERPDGFFWALIACPTNATTTDISLGIANSPWEDVANLQHQGDGGSAGGGEFNASFDAVRGTNGDVAVGLIYGRRDDWVTRMVYVKDDKTIVPIPQNGSSASAVNSGATLLLSADDFERVKEFRLQRRKYQWVEFRNVSLQPGYNTSVEVKNVSDGVNQR